MNGKKYNPKNYQSLFVYARDVHKRSGGICQYCGYGNGNTVDFDLWRQLTVEHIIGESKGGYLKNIKEKIAKKFSKLSKEEIDKYSSEIDNKNRITACHFCNSATSRHIIKKSMDELISEKEGSPNDVIPYVIAELEKIFTDKKTIVAEKITSFKDDFKSIIQPELEEARRKINKK